MQLLANNEVQRHKTSKKELERLRAVIVRDLADASLAGVSADRRFATAYNAALRTAKIAKDEPPPQGNELEAPFGELLVTRRRQMAARADCGRTLSRSHGYFDALFVRTEVGALVDKTPETMAAV